MLILCFWKPSEYQANMIQKKKAEQQMIKYTTANGVPK